MVPANTGSSHTNWSLITDATEGSSPRAAEALDRLTRRYWPAVYAYIRQSGRDVHDAADLTQAFVCEVMLGRKLFQHADPNRGKFRNLLLTALQNFLREQHRNSHREKRMPAQRLLALDRRELETVAPSKHLSPEQAFRSHWRATIIRRSLDRVRASCTAGGLESHWRVFEARVVRPMLLGDKPISYAKLVDLLELDDSGQAANMMIFIKRKFTQTLLDEIGCTVSDPLQIEQELRELLSEVENRQ